MAKKNSSINNRYSRYSWGGDTEIFSDHLGWWERYPMAFSVTDVTYVINSRYHLRPDLLAYDIYGTSQLQTLVLQYNNILDISTEFITGCTIRLPSKERVTSAIVTK